MWRKSKGISEEESKIDKPNIALMLNLKQGNRNQFTNTVALFYFIYSLNCPYELLK